MNSEIIIEAIETLTELAKECADAGDMVSSLYYQKEAEKLKNEANRHRLIGNPSLH